MAARAGDDNSKVGIALPASPAAPAPRHGPGAAVLNNLHLPATRTGRSSESRFRCGVSAGGVEYRVVKSPHCGARNLLIVGPDSLHRRSRKLDSTGKSGVKGR